MLQVPDKAFPFCVKLHMVMELPSPEGAVTQLPARPFAACAGKAKTLRSNKAGTLCLAIISFSRCLTAKSSAPVLRSGFGQAHTDRAAHDLQGLRASVGIVSAPFYYPGKLFHLGSVLRTHLPEPHRLRHCVQGM